MSDRAAAGEGTSSSSTEVDRVRDLVRESYGRAARGGACDAARARRTGESIGYRSEDLGGLPEGANLGLGCGNPTALAGLRPGEVVVDLGSGGGVDCFLAAERVGPEGRVIGIDMTDEMLELARKNAAQAGHENVEFRKGFIEELPVADASVDVVISNCVISLSPDKPRVFREAHRVLRTGGRLYVSDLVLVRPLSERVRAAAERVLGCVAGTLLREDYLHAVRSAGFSSVDVVGESSFAGVLECVPDLAATARDFGLGPEEVSQAAASVVSLKLAARK